jgi:prepilin-type N-terminal cleavage/methylation domain-containing protein
MPYPIGHKSNSAGGSRRSTTAGKRPARRVQGSGFRVQDSGFRIHPSSFIFHPSPSGVTLVEMLIVISIIVILTVASLKLITPAEERRVREAARAVNVYISSARNRAIEIGRPCGVIFRRANGTNFPTVSTVLDQCEVPPTYAGDQTNSVVKVQDWTNRPDGNAYFLDGRIVLKVQIQDGQFASSLLRPGDLMQFNGQGPFFTLVYDDDSGSLRTKPPYTTSPAMNPPMDPAVKDFMPVDKNGNYDPNGYYNFSPSALNVDSQGWVTSHWLTVALNPVEIPLQLLPWDRFPTTPTKTVSFLIMRQPVKSSAEPLQLPQGAAVDLDFSGADYQTFQNPTKNNYDVAVIFSPNGSVEGYYWNGQPFHALGPIYMLVGNRSRVRDFVNSPLQATPNLNDLPNWADLSSVWVTINFQTGMAVSDEIFAINLYDPGLKWNDASTWWPFLFQSRTYARQSQSMGGR